MLRSARHRGLCHQAPREADLVAGEASRAPQAVAPDLFRIACTVDALVADRGEELRLQGEREHVVDAALAGQLLHGTNDRAPETLAVCLAGHRDCGDLG